MGGPTTQRFGQRFVAWGSTLYMFGGLEVRTTLAVLLLFLSCCRCIGIAADVIDVVTVLLCCMCGKWQVASQDFPPMGWGDEWEGTTASRQLLLFLPAPHARLQVATLVAHNDLWALDMAAVMNGNAGLLNQWVQVCKMFAFSCRELQQLAASCAGTATTA